MEKKVLNPKILGAVSAVVLVVVIVLVVFFMKRGDNLTAIVVRLLHSEGEVTLTDDNGNEKSMLEDMNLFTGYVLKTGGDGLVKLGLDETKLVTLNNNSLLGFEKHNKEMKLKLDEGQLFFNVQKKLEDDEKLEIETSTMVVGIRGTSGMVDANQLKITVTDGEVEIHGTNKVTGGENSITLQAGQSVQMNLDNSKEGKESVIFMVQTAKLEDLPDFALKEILQDEDLAGRVAETYEMVVDELLDTVQDIIDSREDKEKEEEEAPGDVAVLVTDESDDTSNNNDRQRSTGNLITDDNTGTSTEDNNTSGDNNSEENNNSSEDNNSEENNNSSEDNNSEENNNSEDDPNNEEEEKPTYSVTVTSSSSAGGTYSSDISNAKEGDTVTITAKANAGYKFVGWTVESGDVKLKDASAATTTFVMGKKEVKIKANFEAISYSISVGANDSSYGRVTASASTAIIGTQITLSASPEPGYTFKEWKVESGGVTVSSSVSESGEGSGSFTMGSANVNITAVFELKKYTISYSIDNPALGEIHFYQSGNEIGSYDATAGVASATGVMGTEFLVRFTPNYFAYLAEEAIDGLSDFSSNEDSDGNMYFEGTYTVGTSDYSGTVPAQMEDTADTEVWFRESVEGEMDDSAFLVNIGGNDATYIFYDGETGYVNGTTVRYSGDGEISAEVRCMSGGVDTQMAGPPVSMDINGTTVYFKKKTVDGEDYYFINLGSGLICANNGNEYEATGESLFIVARSYETGAMFEYEFATSEP
ncbi:MAG: FecR domain-containing protein [Lachnospiraceae bacterium]|nr:FecR domain-containing protein [Lachnospiraceae bacterium]